MLSPKECELARIFTQDLTSDQQINDEFDSLTDEQKQSIFNIVESHLKEHNNSFGKAFAVMVLDFKEVAKNYSVSPSTLFCAYIDIKSKLLRC